MLGGFFMRVILKTRLATSLHYFLPNLRLVYG